jgi:squalene-associated FAD-dependent desaturase
MVAGTSTVVAAGLQPGGPVRCDAVVIGAGFAGLSAAVRLADAGLRVFVAEAAPRLGGRASSFVDRESGERVDNGQHVLFGCYRETYDFLRRVGSADLAPLQSRFTLTMAGTSGRSATLTCPRWPPPWHLIGGVLGWSALTLSDRLRVGRLAPMLLAARRHGAAAVAATVPSGQTVSAWLEARGQSRAIAEWLWHPLAIAALNQSPDIAAAPSFVRVLGELFGPRVEDASIGLPCVPLEDLYAEPARGAIEAHGGTVLTKTPARIVLDDAGGMIGVRAGETLVTAPVVISAVPWHGFDRIWMNGVPPQLDFVARNAAAMAGSPIVTVNLWLDGPASPAPIVGLVGGPMHWLFDKGAIFGYDDGHLSIVSSGADELAARENADIVALAREQLSLTLAAFASRQIRRAVVVRERRATFSLAPGAPARPATITPLDGLFLAGDWTDTGLPATIEGAVISGHRAADAARDWLRKSRA